jgi:Brp/Blh family beta-carotene 15,15'-monooxygenase
MSRLPPVRTGRLVPALAPDGPAGLAVWASRSVLVAVAAVVAALDAAGTTPAVATQSWVYLALMLGVSLPHGGFEHVANLKGRGESFQASYLLAYVALLGATFALFAVAPIAGLAVAVAITMLKGGHGGLQVLGSVADLSHLRARWQRALAVAVRGGAVMAVPFVVFPGDFSVVAFEMVGAFAPQRAYAIGPAFAGEVRTAVGAGYAALVGVHLLVGAARADGVGRGWATDAFETVLLAGYFVVVPPILAVGVYFPCWYATRQVARLGADGGVERPELGRAARRFLRGAAAPWVASLAIFGAVAAAVPSPPATAVGWAALYSVVVAAIAVPHVAVGSWLDRRQGIWSVAA